MCHKFTIILDDISPMFNLSYESSRVISGKMVFMLEQGAGDIY